VSKLVPEILDSARLLLDLQQVNDIAGRILDCQTPEAIAQKITDGLVEKFDCAFSRIWLVEPNQSELRLVASSVNGCIAGINRSAIFSTKPECLRKT
jgi:GAF domain-containing protein